MSDRMDDVLASIDDVLTACICGQPIPTDGPSLDYCSPGCQYRTMADRVGAYPDPDQWDEPMPPRQPGALLEMRLGNLRVSAERPAQWLWVPSIADPAAPTRAELDGGVELRNYHNPVSFDFTVTEANREAVDVFFDDADDPRRAIRDNLDRLQQDLADRLGCPVGQLRLLTEYIGRRMATEDMTPQQAEERMLQLVQACSLRQ